MERKAERRWSSGDKIGRVESAVVPGRRGRAVVRGVRRGGMMGVGKKES